MNGDVRIPAIFFIIVKHFDASKNSVSAFLSVEESDYNGLFQYHKLAPRAPEADLEYL